jgi:hypothetical protein
MTQHSGNGPESPGAIHGMFTVGPKGTWIERNVPSQSERSIRTPQEE